MQGVIPWEQWASHCPWALAEVTLWSDEGLGSDSEKPWRRTLAWVINRPVLTKRSHASLVTPRVFFLVVPGIQISPLGFNSSKFESQTPHLQYWGSSTPVAALSGASVSSPGKWRSETFTSQDLCADEMGSHGRCGKPRIAPGPASDSPLCEQKARGVRGEKAGAWFNFLELLGIWVPQTLYFSHAWELHHWWATPLLAQEDTISNKDSSF